MDVIEAALDRGLTGILAGPIVDPEAVRQAISFCAEQKLGLLQVLPINETGDDNSPYNAISSVALDPVYLTLTPELVPGLQQETLTQMFPDPLRAQLQHGKLVLS